MQEPSDRDVRAAGELPGARLSAPVLVGRDRELGLLLQATSSPPVVIAVEGEAGIGKTRLIREALEELEGRRTTTLLGRCHPLREPFPLGPVVEALRAAAPALTAAPRLSAVTGVLRPLLPELEDRLPPAPPGPGDVMADRHRVFRALCELLDGLGPTVLTLEDLHWADGTTVEFLSYLLPELPSRLSLVLTYRRESLPDSSPLEALIARLPRGVMSLNVALRALGPDDVGKLVSAILDGERVSPAFAAYLHERSGGLPLAVEELIRLLKDRRDIVRRGGAWARRAIDEIELPHAVRGLFLERLARLSADARMVAEAAAVVGDAADEALLFHVSGLPFRRGVEALSEAVSSALLEEGTRGMVAFRHSLAREAVETAIPGPRRRRLHLRAAQALEKRRPAPLERLARHYREAGRALKLAQYAEAAARAARERGDDGRAVQLLIDAVDGPDIPPRKRARLTLTLADAALHALAHDEAIPVLERVLGQDPPADLRGELRLALGRLLVQAGRGSDAEERFEVAARELRGRPAIAARALANLALPTTFEHRSWHLRRADQALSLLQDRGSTLARTAVLGDRAATLLYFGQRDAPAAIAAVPAPGRSPEQRRELVRVFHNLAEASISLGDYPGAQAFLDRARGLAGELRYERFAGHLEALAGGLDWARGDWERLPDREAAIEESASSAGPLAEIHLVLGLRALTRGDSREAERLLSSASESAAAAGWAPLLVAASAGLTRLALMRGEPRAAVDASAPGLDALRRKDAWVWGGDLVPLGVEAFALNDPAAADRLVAELARGIRGRIAPSARVALATCRGILAEVREDAEEAARRFRSAERAWAALPRPYDAARARAARGNLLLGASDERGAELMRSALDTFERLGASTDAARVRGMLRRHGLRPRGVGGRPSYGDGLSPREQEVARLVAGGLRNREIAEALFLSTRTVEFHIANLMRKLKAPTRTALALAAMERPSPGVE